MYGAIQKLQMQNKLLYLNDLNCMQNNIQSIVHPENVEYPSKLLKMWPLLPVGPVLT